MKDKGQATLQQCKDQVAKDCGFQDWEHIVESYNPAKLVDLTDEVAEIYASQKLEEYRRLSSKEDQVTIKDAEQFAMEFADYIENERWRYDYSEQKTHSYSEHLEHFKQVYGGVRPESEQI